MTAWLACRVKAEEVGVIHLIHYSTATLSLNFVIVGVSVAITVIAPNTSHCIMYKILAKGCMVSLRNYICICVLQVGVQMYLTC